MLAGIGWQDAVVAVRDDIDVPAGCWLVGIDTSHAGFAAFGVFPEQRIQNANVNFGG